MAHTIAHISRFFVTEWVKAKGVTGTRVGTSHKQSIGMVSMLKISSDMFYFSMQRHSLGRSSSFFWGEVEGKLMVIGEVSASNWTHVSTYHWCFLSTQQQQKLSWIWCHQTGDLVVVIRCHPRPSQDDLLWQVDQIPVSRLIGPGVKVDMTVKVSNCAKIVCPVPNISLCGKWLNSEHLDSWDGPTSQVYKRTGCKLKLFLFLYRTSINCSEQGARGWLGQCAATWRPRVLGERAWHDTQWCCGHCPHWPWEVTILLKPNLNFCQGYITIGQHILDTLRTLR